MFLKLKKMILFLVIVLILFINTNSEAKVVKTTDLDVELISELISVKPGSEFWAGIRLRMKNDCHIYWVNPGDVGIPTNIDLVFPSGFSSQQVYFPVPKLFIETEIASLIYEDEIILPFRVSVPDNFAEKDFFIRANINWLACKEICTADSAKPFLKIKVSNQNQKVNRKWSERLKSTVNLLPVTYNSEQIFANKNDTTVILTFGQHDLNLFSNYDRIQFFPYEQGIYELSEIQKFELNERYASLEIPMANLKVKEPEILSGIIKLDNLETNESISYEINVSIINNIKELK